MTGVVKKRSKLMMLTNFILSAAATICITVIVGMLVVLFKELPVKSESRDRIRNKHTS